MDNIQLPNSNIISATDEISGIHYQKVKLIVGNDGIDSGSVSPTNPLPVSLDAPSLAALENINVSVSNPGLTDAQLRATAVPVQLNGVALDTSIASLITAVNSLKTVVESLDTKTVAVNTGAVTISNPTPQGLTDSQLRAQEIQTSDAQLRTSATSLESISTSLKEITDTQMYLLSAILEKLPRLDRNDRGNVMVSDASGNELNSAYYGVSVNLVGEPTGGRSYLRIMEPWNFSDAGSARLYQQIQVS